MGLPYGCFFFFFWWSDLSVVSRFHFYILISLFPGCPVFRTPLRLLKISYASYILKNAYRCFVSAFRCYHENTDWPHIVSAHTSSEPPGWPGLPNTDARWSCPLRGDIYTHTHGLPFALHVFLMCTQPHCLVPLSSAALALLFQVFSSFSPFRSSSPFSSRKHNIKVYF